MRRILLVGLFALPIALPLHETATTQPASAEKSPDASRLKVPPGFTVEVVAAPPLVHHPMMANFDERGRLFIAESSGLNLKAAELLKELPNKVLLLEGVDDKGRFTKSKIFADKMTFPSGALWHQNALYVTAAPHIWKIRDTKNVGVADERTELISKFNFIGNAADVHGPFLGPDGRIYWCDGRHGHEIVKKDGSVSKGKAARIFRCKPDGSELEVVCGGGMDNPVEIAFTEEGEPLVTVDILHNMPSRNDGIIFAIEGGNYPWHEVSKEFPRTGDLLPAVENLGWVAPSGLMRYRSAAFGKEYQGNLFSAQFNRHRIQRHTLERFGASFKCKTEDFLTTDDKNFHPTDVFEDADGSLIVIDTGGWFRIGCPTSQIARPEFKGAIYRIRRADTKPMDDPRGLGIAWAKQTPPDLIKLFADPRFAVRDRAIEELSQHKEAAQWLERSLSSESAQTRRNIVWTATRIDDPAVRHVARLAIGDEDLSVKLAAIHSVGLHRDEKAASWLLRVLKNDAHPAARRQAATALGRIKHVKAMGSLMDAMRSSKGDRFLEHALIYALIQIDNRDKTAPFLNDRDPNVCRAALIALDQMAHGNLTREELSGQLNSDDKALTKTALDIVASRPKWASEIVGLLRDGLVERNADAARRESLRGLLLALSKEAAIQDLMVQALQNDKTALAMRLVILETMGRAPLTKLPAAWEKALGKALDDSDGAIVQQATATIRSRNMKSFDAQLDRIVHDPKCTDEVRVQAFGALGERAKVDEAAFRFLATQLKNGRSPLIRLAAAKGLAQANLSWPQLEELASTVVEAGPLELPAILPAFEKNQSPIFGLTLFRALEKNKSIASLPPDVITKTVKNWPPEARKFSIKLTERLQVDAAKQKARIDELEPLATGGSLEQGRDIFFGNKALCSTCHAINNKGGGVGPDLGKIGAIRSGRDLLESIVFPSASFARGFEPYVIETKAGKTHNGILARESTDAIYLLTTERAEIRIGREEIETFAPGRVSIMPAGLETTLSRRQLQDLLAYLQSLR
jgi:putative membrane-bound dehydrogenase-like protein